MQPQHQVPIFSLQDMRFFQHFLLNCYPHHPIGSEAIWTHEIPCLSQKVLLPFDPPSTQTIPATNPSSTNT